MTLDYSINMQDSAGRVATLHIDGASIDNLMADDYSFSSAQASVESNAFSNAIANGEIGADAWVI